MAKVTMKSVVVQPAVAEVRENVIHLELSEDEALTLRAIFQNIGGNLVISRRQHVKDIDAQLEQCNLGKTVRRDYYFTPYSTALYFKDHV